MDAGRSEIRAVRRRGSLSADPGAGAGLEEVSRLRELVTRLDPREARATQRLLRSWASRPIEDPRVLRAYHDCLLFVVAHPPSPTVLESAERELERVAEASRALRARGARYRRALRGTGIAWTEVVAAFSLPIARWLVERHPANAEIDYLDPDGEAVGLVLAPGMPDLEETILSSGLENSAALLAELTEGLPGSRLAWLLGQIARLPASEPIRERAFESLRAYVRIRPEATALSRTFARGLPTDTFFHEGPAIRRANAAAMMEAPLPPPRRLSAGDRLLLIDAARATLAMLGRETDPISLCRPEGVEFHELDRGLSVALYSAPPERRFALDPHIGFVLFKNTLPVAYGGGWPFLGLCKIGVNIFEPYRGGESAYLFSQVLRVYAQRCGARRFLVEPYQFGAGNSEGLASGAFWFYHRLGFRPVDPSPAALAERESRLMQADPAYRSPRSVLRRLARSDLELLRAGAGGPATRCDPSELSLAVSRAIRVRWSGDRGRAERESVREVTHSLGIQDIASWPEQQARAFLAQCPLLALIPDLDQWLPRERQALVTLLLAKGAEREFRGLKLANRHRRYRQAMLDLCAETTG